MTAENSDSRETCEASETRTSRGRRAFIAGAGVSLAALAGCTINVDPGGGGSNSEPRTETQDPTDTPNESPTANESATPNESPTANESASPTTATPEQDSEFEIIPVQPEPIDVGLVHPTPELRYRVERLYLYIEEASDAAFDGPNTEEIYGEIRVAASDGTNAVETTLGRDLLWSAQPDGYREIADSEGVLLDPMFTPVEFVFTDPESIDDDAYIDVSADLSERDRGANPDDQLTRFNTGKKWFLDGETVDSGYSRPDGQSHFITRYGGNGTELNLSYNVVEG